MKIAIANDHAAVEMKDFIRDYLTELGHEVNDLGCFAGERADYPDYAKKVGLEVTAGNAELGILICGSGVGMSIAANKIKGIRAVCCSEPYSAKMSRMHNDANVLCFGARIVGPELAKMIVDEFLGASFLGERHAMRVDKIKALEA
ncbi:MAG: ribose 5-phosphate isomerase B [Eubacteriales bacterium]|nr:ribose 5-phosphate isomerase B [Eubacteriales bacterium]